MHERLVTPACRAWYDEFERLARESHMLSVRLPIVAFAFSCVLIASRTWADIPPPNTYDCRIKHAGDACVTDRVARGICHLETCYQGTDAKPSSECLICRESNAGNDSSGCSLSGRRATSPEWLAASQWLLLAWFARRRLRPRRSGR